MLQADKLRPWIRNSWRPAAGVLGIMAGAGLAWLVVWLSTTAAAELIVKDAAWTRTIHVDALRTVVDGGWDIPPSGRKLDKERRVHHWTYRTETYTESYDCDGGTPGYRYRPPGYRMKPGGGFGYDPGGFGYGYDLMGLGCTRTKTRQVRDRPIYQDWYTYEIERWQPSRDVESAGKWAALKWPDVAFSPATGPHGTGQEKERGRDCVYVLTLTDGNGRDYPPVAVAEADYLAACRAERVTARINRWGTIRRISCNPANERE